MRLPRRGFAIATIVFAVLAIVLLSQSQLAAQAPPASIGRVEGRDFTIEGPPGSTPVWVGAARVLTSGSRIVVNSGQARILLDGGGEIVICGPARLQLLKSQGALTVALDFGTVHVDVEDAEPLAVFTPLVLATTVAISGGPRNATIGLDPSGQMCLRSTRGAIRIEQQLSGESLLVPQSGGLTLSGGQVSAISASAPGCACEVDAAQLSPLKPQATHETIGVAASAPINPAPEPKKSPLPGKIAPPISRSSGVTVGQILSDSPSVETPIFTVLMPPLIFNASNPEPPPDLSPEIFVLVRSVRVREDMVYRGVIEPSAKKKQDVPAANADPAPVRNQQGVFSRIGGFFRHAFGG